MLVYLKAFASPDGGQFAEPCLTIAIPSKLTVICFMEGWTDAGLGKMPPQLLDVLLGELIAMVWMVQDKFNAV